MSKTFWKNEFDSEFQISLEFLEFMLIFGSS